MERGESQPTTPSTPESGEPRRASEIRGVLNELQRQVALLKFAETHPRRQIDPTSPSDRHEVMTEWVNSGNAAAFDEEFGTEPDPQEIRKALARLRQNDTLH